MNYLLIHYLSNSGNISSSNISSSSSSSNSSSRSRRSSRNSCSNSIAVAVVVTAVTVIIQVVAVAAATSSNGAIFSYSINVVQAYEVKLSNLYCISVVSIDCNLGCQTTAIIS